MKKNVFGIDLGTTYSCIAYVDEHDKPIVLKNIDGALTTPSVVYFESETNIVVGEEAKRCLEVEPEKTVAFVKRKMGKSDNTMEIDGNTYTAQEVSSYILRKIVNDAESELRQRRVIAETEKITDVVITCPAYFGLDERNATRSAGELAGLNVLGIINEPTAAAISYGAINRDRNETVLIYDLGGGTFDITIININNGNIDVVCTGGNNQLGGKDWDEAIIKFFVRKFYNEKHQDISKDLDTMQSLYIEAEKAKKSLTMRTKTPVAIHHMGERLKFDFTRQDFEFITKELLDKTKLLVNECLDVANKKGYPLNKIDKFLLVGGSSKMPQVSEMIKREYNVKPILQEPDEAVAKGAAIYAQNMQEFNDFILDVSRSTGKSVEQLNQEEREYGTVSATFAQQSLILSGIKGMGRLQIKNVLSRTYGIIALNEKEVPVIVNMLLMNSKLPASKTMTFYTHVNNQDSVTLDIYESRDTNRHSKLEGLEPIVKVTMEFSKKVPMNTPIITTMTLDNEGMLHLRAEEQAYKSKLNTTFKLRNDMSDVQRAKAMARHNSAKVE